MAEAAQKTTPAKRRQGPKRSESSRAAILQATRDEIAEQGWRSFSVDNVAKRASASKQTIYRWWPSIGCICIEAALALIPDAPKGVRDPIERITAIIVPLEAAARTGSGHAVLRGALTAAIDDAEAGEAWRKWLQRDVRQPLRIVLAELASKRIISRDLDVDDAVSILLGPLWHQLLIARSPVKEGYSKRQAEALLKAYGANA